MKCNQYVNGCIEFATETFDPNQFDGELYKHQDLLYIIPKRTHFEVAIRCDTITNVTQIHFNNDIWYDFIPGPKVLFTKLSELDINPLKKL